LNTAVPRDLETICEKCLQKEPSRRYSSARALADDLRRWLDGRTIAARPIGPLERLGRWAKRNPAVASLVTAVFALLTAVAVGAVIAAVRIDDARGLESNARQAAQAAMISEADAKNQAQEAAAAAKYQLTRLHISNGAQAQERRDQFTALLWYARAWQGNPDAANESSHRVRLGAVLNGLPRLSGVCFHPTGVDDVDIDAAGKRVVTRTADRSGIRGNTAYIWDYAAARAFRCGALHRLPRISRP
jgi:hypothetical protein